MKNNPEKDERVILEQITVHEKALAALATEIRDGVSAAKEAKTAAEVVVAGFLENPSRISLSDAIRAHTELQAATALVSGLAAVENVVKWRQTAYCAAVGDELKELVGRLIAIRTKNYPEWRANAAKDIGEITTALELCNGTLEQVDALSAKLDAAKNRLGDGDEVHHRAQTLLREIISKPGEESLRSAKEVALSLSYA